MGDGVNPFVVLDGTDSNQSQQSAVQQDEN